MDDYLTIFDADLNNSKKYESVQSRFFHLHVPPEEVKWTVCDFCGCPVNKLLFENHILRHELVGITYTLYHFELREEKQRQELIQRIQAKEQLNGQRRKRALDSNLESSSSSPSSSSSSESSTHSDSDAEKFKHQKDNSKQLPCLRNTHILSGIKRKRVNTVKKRLGNTRRNKSKPNNIPNKWKSKGILTQLDKKSLVNGQKDGESAEEYDADEMVDVVSVKLEDEEDEKENGRNLEREEEEGRKRRETEEEEEKERRREERRKGEQQRRGKERRRHLEGGLMRQYLGPNHHRVFVDNSAALETYFDRRTGRVRMNSLIRSPPRRRRSLRGVHREEDEELHCLL